MRLLLHWLALDALEFHHLDNELWAGLVEEGPLIVDGYIAVGERSGLGVTLDEGVAKAAAKESLGFFG